MPALSPGQKKSLIIAATLAAIVAVTALPAPTSPFVRTARAAADKTTAAAAIKKAAADAAGQAAADAVRKAASDAAGAAVETAASDLAVSDTAAKNATDLAPAVGSFWKLAWEKARPFLTQVWGALRNIFAHFWNWLSSIAKEPPAPANANTNAATDTNININSDAPSPAAGE